MILDNSRKVKTALEVGQERRKESPGGVLGNIHPFIADARDRALCQAPPIIY